MLEELDYRARRIFADFVESFEERGGRRDWWLEFPEEELTKLCMTYDEAEGALELLQSVGLIERLSMDGWKLSDDGYRACRHRELIDQALGTRPPAASMPLQIVAQQVIIGNHNSLQVNSDEVIAKLVAHITADAAIEPEKKKRWLEVLKDVGKHIAAEGLKVLVDKAIGK